MKNGTTKFILKSKPNFGEYQYIVLVKSYSGNLWESFDAWVGYGNNSKEAKNNIIEMMQDGPYIKQAIDNILSDTPGKDINGNPIFLKARGYFIEKYDFANTHPLFSGILANFGLK